jgi:hypothetical protein
VLARGALRSERGLERLTAELRQLVPQLDRVCWTAVEDGQLVVKQCVQEPSLEGRVGGAGRKVPAARVALAKYAAEGRPRVHDDLAAERGLDRLDLVFMARAYGASCHVPVKIDGRPGTINFWSTEKQAFPQEATNLLAEIAAAMADGPN